jgi:hypothetical protein
VDAKSREKKVKLFDITGRVMKGWVMVGEQEWKKEEDLKSWLNLGKKCALTLSKKHA